MSNKLKWAIIGVGKYSPQRGGVNAIAYAHAEAVKRNGDKLELVGGASLVQDFLDDFTREYPCRGFIDYREMLRETKPDVVSICTWAKDRELHVMDAIHGGVKAVLIEKPLALSMVAAKRIKAEAEKYNVRIFIHFQRRFGQPFQWLKKAVADGTLGKIQSIEISQPCNNLLDFGPHFINTALYVMPESKLKAIHAAADFSGDCPWHGIKVEKQLDGIVYFEDGCRWYVSAGGINKPERPAFRVNGSEGFAELYLIKPEGAGSVFRCVSSKTPGASSPVTDQNFHHGDVDTYLYFEKCFADIGEAIINHQPSLVDLADGMMTNEILLGLYSSAQQQRMLTYPGDIADPVFETL